jgi:hypothetical protein
VVGDELEHLSKKTRERAFILARNAKSIGLPLGAVRFTPHYDYMSYYLTNSTDYIIIFCTPEGYLVELWSDASGTPAASFFAIKNIRHFLQLIKREGYKDIDIMFEDIGQDDEVDLRDWLEDGLGPDDDN